MITYKVIKCIITKYNIVAQTRTKQIISMASIWIIFSVSLSWHVQTETLLCFHELSLTIFSKLKIKVIF